MTMTPESQNALAETIFVGSSEMAGLMRSYDWSHSALGSVETWSESLKTGIRIILGSRYPMFIWWGQDLINFYNDAYIPMLGQRHPAALGQPAREIWGKDIWHLVGPQAEDVFREGKASWNEELLEIMERNGYPEETYFTFSYSPIGADDGSVGGVFCACTEDTRRVLNERRLRTVRELGAETAQAKTVDEACQISAEVLAHNLKDIPFALIYLLDSNQQQARLMSTTHLDLDTIASPRVIDLGDPASDCWSLQSVLATRETRVIDQLSDRFGVLSGGAWDEPSKSAIVLPLARPGQETLGVLIAGISPYRSLDDDYRGFFNLVAGQVTTAVTNTLAYEEERKQAEVLAELDRVKTTFFNNVSHEFRTPLTLMLVPAEDALADPENALPRVQRQRVEVIQRNGLRLLKLVNTLLDFSRIEADRASALYEPTDLATFTTELASVFRSAIERAEMRLVVDCPPLPELVYVDRDLWEKIVLNLISNAFKFTFAGEITVRLQSIEPEQVELTVQDTGVGIPAAEIPHLFERFHRVKGSKGRTFEGSGIGLSLVQELVNLHRGTVEVTSIEGEGSCFKVCIPTGCAHLPADRISTTQTTSSPAVRSMPYVAEALRWLPEESLELEDPNVTSQAQSSKFETQSSDFQAQRSKFQAQSSKFEAQRSKFQAQSSESETPNSMFLAPDSEFQASSSTVKASGSKPARVLLVDDNADMRGYLRRLLSQRWQVETAANGAIALNLIQQQPPDLVLSDVMMPEMDGFQLLHALRSDPQTKSIPIILLSAWAGEEATIEGLTAGADDYLIKPFSARELMARVETQLQMSRLRQEHSANQFKNEFLRTITHELQAPLASILAWARLLQSQPFDTERMARALSTIERNAVVEAKLVKDLLDVSSMLSGNLHLKLQLVELAPLVQNTIAPLQRSAEAKQIQFVETISPTVQGNVLADGDRLRQILTILVENAIKFTPAGGQVDFRIERLGSEIQITVSDTGIGISPEFLPQVFDRFSQAEVPSLHSPGGVGIGLAIAQYLVELHHGTIGVTSEGEGRGTTFTVRLPLINAAPIHSDLPVQE